ncbi:MAG: sigma factor-like helix-turn-helix DNA-binding protein, partial [Gallionella sp.]|nr:sigma factor-like helix-turn-helix DNA-binding protein [Gallionella sp.]
MTQLQQSNSTNRFNSNNQPDAKPVLQQMQLKTRMNGDFIEYFIAAQKSALTERESQIIEMRYGFGEDKAQTLEQIGQRIGVTKERIRQIA